MKRALACLLLTLAVGGTITTGAAAPAATESTAGPALTAAFLYTFAKFAEWPPDALAPRAPIQLCVDDAGVAEALEPLVVGRRIGDHAMVVVRVSSATILPPCHVLYVGGLDARRTKALLSALGDAAVWSISDYNRFTALGGVAHLFKDGDRLRFAINVESARRVRLEISSRLLGLATIVRDEN